MRGGVDELELVVRGLTGRLHFHVPVERQQVLSHRGRQSTEATLMFGMAPPGVVKRRRLVEEKAGRPHAVGAAGLSTAPTGTASESDAMRSWMDFTSWVRVFRAIRASHAADVADIVVR